MPKGEEAPEGVKEGAPSRQAQGKEETPFRRLTPQEIRNQRLGKEGEATTAAIEGMVVPSMGEGQKGEMGKEKHKDEKEDSFVEASVDTASITLPLFDTPVAQ